MPKRPAEKKRTSSPPRTEVGLVENVAVAVGTALGRLVKRKNALLAQLSEVEARIADASRRAGSQLNAYLPTAIGGLTKTRKATAKEGRRRSSRKTTAPPPAHGPDTATADTIRNAQAPSTRTGGRAAARPRSAPRGTRRG